MALQKDIESPHGAIASYWRVVGLKIDSLGGAARIILAGYVTQAAREANKPHLGIRFFTISGAGFQMLSSGEPQGPTLFDAVARAAYEYIKQPEAEDEQGRQGEFADAEDV